MIYQVKLVYHNPMLSQQFKEHVTNCAVTQLFSQGIHTAQTTATRIAFECDQDRVLGLMLLSESEDYTTVCLP